MARKGKIESNKRKKNLIEKHSKLRDELRAKSRRVDLPIEERLEAKKRLELLPRSSMKIRDRRICNFSGRSRGIIKSVGISRIDFRESMALAVLPGYTKCSS